LALSHGVVQFVENLLGSARVRGEWRRRRFFPIKCFGAKDFDHRQRKHQIWRVAAAILTRSVG
jgi:hypothetical protein